MPESVTREGTDMKAMATRPEANRFRSLAETIGGTFEISTAVSRLDILYIYVYLYEYTDQDSARKARLGLPIVKSKYVMW